MKIFPLRILSQYDRAKILLQIIEDAERLKKNQRISTSNIKTEMAEACKVFNQRNLTAVDSVNKGIKEGSNL